MVPGQCPEPQDNVLGSHPWSYSFRTHSPHKNDHPPPPNYTASRRRPVVIRVVSGVACGHLGPKGCTPCEQSPRMHSPQEKATHRYYITPNSVSAGCARGLRCGWLGAAQTLRDGSPEGNNLERTRPTKMANPYDHTTPYSVRAGSYHRGLIAFVTCAWMPGPGLSL